ncbi:MAG TPA: transporter substrate-binding domain-containing protein [Opitutaceae bacterium]|nr:transporter substrate-binding domain-containing protein [Opitutaceae bacterium]
MPTFRFNALSQLLLALTGFAAILAGGVVRARAQSAQKPLPAKLISLASPTDQYPLSYLENGQLTGFSAELTDAAAHAVGLKVEHVLAPTAELRRRFENGQFDVLQSYVPVPGQPFFGSASDPYLTLRGAIYARKDFRGLRILSDLKNARMVFVGRNGTGEQLASDHEIVPREIIRCSSMDEALHMIENGDADAVFASRAIAASIIERDNLNNVRSLAIVPDGYERRHCIAVHEGDPAKLLAKLNQGFAIIQRTGEHDQIYQRWFGRFDAPVLSREQVIRYAAPTLAIALAVTIFAFFHQRKLRRRLTRQTKQLAENEALLAEAQRIAHVGHWRYDTATRELTCSPEMLRILERDPRHGDLTYARILQMVPKSERAALHRSARTALKGGGGGELTLSVFPRPDLRKVIQFKAQALQAEPGAENHVLLGTIQDITQQKVFEEDLHTREQLLRAIYDNVPSGLGVVETAGNTFRFISANPGTARLFGLDSNYALAGRLLSNLHLPDDVTHFWIHWFRRALSRTEILKAEASLELGKKHFSLTLIPLGIGHTGQAQLCFLVEDVTERKQIDAEISQGRRLRAVGELVGGIAHEFNNLLTPILLKAELLSTEWQHDHRLNEELGSISRAAQRGADLTRRLLAFGRRSEPENAEVKLSALIRANIDLLRPTIDRRIQLISEVPESLPSLFLNPSDLHQIVLNLLLNARDTLVEKLNKTVDDSWRAHIRVEAASYGPHAIESTNWEKAEAPAGWLCLTLSDNGMGMPQHVQERIFEPFYTTKEVGKGTGLGLATVWHLVTRMGGKIVLQSRVGEGTSFQMWLPVVPAPNAAAAKAETRSPIPDRAGVRICLVEDDELVAHTMATTLRRQHHHVTHYRHGSEAWRHLSLHATGYDLLLLDLDLPGINGIEIARRIRGMRFPGKILVASGRLTESDAREFENIGVDAHLEKPFNPQKLQATIQTCMKGAAKLAAAKA